MNLLIREKKDLISAGEDDQIADGVAPAPVVPAKTKAKAKKDVGDALFASSEEEVQVVDNAAPATKEVEVNEVSEKLDECT